MEAKQIVDTALIYAGKSIGPLAAELGMSYQALYKKLKNGKLSLEEWDRIAKAMGAEKAEMHIYFPDGKEI